MPQLLGKRKARFDQRNLKLRKYLPAHLPPRPFQKNWLMGIPQIPMYLNNSLGDCVIACMAHQLDLWSYLTTGKIIGFTDAEIISMYTAIGGYDPAQIQSDGSNPTDNGCDMLTAMKYWQQTGFAGHKEFAIEAFLQVDASSPTEFMDAIWLFGSSNIGVQLPLAVQNLSGWPAPPSLTGDWTPGGWGGHCIDPGAYFLGNQLVETWGETLQMSDIFFKSYCDEMFVVLYPGWVGAHGVTPSGLNIAQLQADLALL
jgi:hypothetical protein